LLPKAKRKKGRKRASTGHVVKEGKIPTQQKHTWTRIFFRGKKKKRGGGPRKRGHPTQPPCNQPGKGGTGGKRQNGGEQGAIKNTCICPKGEEKKRKTSKKGRKGVQGKKRNVQKLRYKVSGQGPNERGEWVGGEKRGRQNILMGRMRNKKALWEKK